MTTPAYALRKGLRFKLPSGKTVELLHIALSGVWDAAYIVNGELAPAGKGLRGRVSLRADFIQQHGRAVQ